MRAVLLGSIGVLAETSDMQREAFNAAFAEAGLDWYWDRDDYARRLARAGGAARIAAEARAQGVAVDARALHRRKSEIFRDGLAARPPALRPGVAETMAAASARGVALGLVTATSEGNVAALLTALGLGRAGFATVVHRERIGRPKPEPDAYLRALDDLALDAGAAIAVEDNPDGAIAACSAGVTCVALPGALHAGSAFPAGVERQATLDLASRLAA